MKTTGFLALLWGFGLSILLPGEAAAKGCIHAWALPGTYTVSGNFRGKVETAGARLTRDCRAILQVPGVASGAKVRKSGRCLRFGFKVQGVKKVFSAKWCNKVGIVPWNGRNINVKVRHVKRGAKSAGNTNRKQNFNLTK